MNILTIMIIYMAVVLLIGYILLMELYKYDALDSSCFAPVILLFIPIFNLIGVVGLLYFVYLEIDYELEEKILDKIFMIKRDVNEN
jgi:hypothetical protein